MLQRKARAVAADADRSGLAQDVCTLLACVLGNTDCWCRRSGFELSFRMKIQSVKESNERPHVE
jgi:hypothetical protein